VRRLPPLTSIEAFVQVAREGSVKAAAEKLSLSSPALSRRVQALERFVGMPLFERRHQAIVLNADGEKLLDRIAPALDMLSDAIEISTGVGQEILRLRLSVPPLFASQRLMPHMGALRAQHPNLHVDMNTTINGIARLNDGIDAAVVLVREVEPSLYSREITSGRIVLIAARSLAESLGKSFEPEDIRKLTVLLHNDLRDSFDVWREAVGRPDLEPLTIDYFDSGQLILDAAAAGLGVAFMFDGHLAATADSRLVALSDTHMTSPHSYWFACRKSALSSRSVRLFHDWLFETLPTEAE
jgi:LysR family transcriptional regulator, glycine cleavage system transcriptional activator